MDNVRYYIQITDDFEHSCELVEKFLAFGKSQGYDIKPNWFRSWSIPRLVQCDINYVKHNPKGKHRIYFFDHLKDGSFEFNGWDFDIFKSVCDKKNLQLINWEDENISEISIF